MVKKTIAAIAAAAVLSGTLGVVATAAPQHDEAPIEEVVAGSSWSRSSVHFKVGPVKGGAVIQFGSSWS